MADNNKPRYICDLEKEILTLTPGQALDVQAFVRALKARRTESEDKQSKSPLISSPTKEPM